jgi:8-oxo-dGTP pyrophosphatase MutT (NUDIX family)
VPTPLGRTNLTFTSELRHRIATNLAQLEPLILSAHELRHAAVGVVLVADDADRACFILTRRISTLRRHGGQWALPGGRLESGDTLEAAVLREIHEEVGLALPPGAIVGRLDDLQSRSGHLISPFVIWSENTGPLIASPDEVDAAYRVPLHDLDRPGSLQLEPLLHFDLVELESTVHAPTAAILYQFLEVAIRGRSVHVGHIEQPYFAWR